MTINLKYTVVISLVLAIVFMFSVQFVSANPSFFIRQNNGTTTTATTSVAYMTVGTATTTYYFDSQANGNPNGAESATLLWQFTASSTNSTQDMYLEYAQSGENCISAPTSCDWYYHATSTVSNPSVAATSYFARWQFASTTSGLGTSGANRGLREIEIPTPTRYARVMFVVPYQLIAEGTASSSAVWAEIVAKKENR